MTALEQLLRDAMAEHTDGVPHLRPGTARAVLRRSHRTSRVRLVAATTATVAATAGVGAFAVSLQPSGTAAGTVGAGSTGTVSPGPASSSAPRQAPVSTGAAPRGSWAPEKAPGDAPADLVAISLPFLAPGFPGRRAPDSVSLISVGDGTTNWVHNFLVGSDDPRQGKEATVMVEAGQDTFVRNPDSPDPHITSVTVDGHAGTIYSSGTDHDLYFRAGRFTVLVSGGAGATDDELVALGAAVQGLPS